MAKFTEVDKLVKGYQEVVFLTLDEKPGMIGVEHGMEEPARLWVSTETARIIWKDLIDQGYVKGIL